MVRLKIFFKICIVFLTLFNMSKALADGNNRLAEEIEKYQYQSNGHRRVLKLLNHLIHSVRDKDHYTRTAKVRNVFNLLKQVDEAGIPLDVKSYQTALKAFEEFKNINAAIELFEEMQHSELPDIVLYEAVINTCIGAGEYDKAMDFFNEAIELGVYLVPEWNSKIIDFHIDKWVTKESLDALIKLKIVNRNHYCGIPSNMVFMILEQIELKKSRNGLSGKIIIVGHNGKSKLKNAVQDFLDYYHYQYSLDSHDTFEVDRKKKFVADRFPPKFSGDLKKKMSFTSRTASSSLSYADACLGSVSSSTIDLKEYESASDEKSLVSLKEDLEEIDTANRENYNKIIDDSFGSYAEVCKTPPTPTYCKLSTLGGGKDGKSKSRWVRSMPAIQPSLSSITTDSDMEQDAQHEDDLSEPETVTEPESLGCPDITTKPGLNPKAAVFKPSQSVMTKLNSKN